MLNFNKQKGMKVLIVEDEEALLEIVQKQLAQEKYTVKTAKDGEEAIKEAKSFHPDIMILDLVLPKKKGLEVLAEIKADEKLKDISVIVVSNLSDDESIKEALRLGAADYFVKTQHSVFEILEKVSGQLKN